jgi:hypothetical protein
VVRHEHICVYVAPVTKARLPQALQVETPVVFREEHWGTVIAALGDVLRVSRQRKPRGSGHGLVLFLGGPPILRGVTRGANSQSALTRLVVF